MTPTTVSLFCGAGGESLGRDVAALYVERGGCYYDLPGVDPWDEARDARLYAGPWPVVAHPPCERWGRYYQGGPSWVKRGNAPKALGDDAGCFAAALSSVRVWGGVLEHPAGSRAWQAFGLNEPRGIGWTSADMVGGWTCQVEQGHFGHRARKPTWLYAVGCVLPSLPWGPSGIALPDQEGSARSRGKRVANDAVERMCHRERLATPVPLRDLLLSIARSARGAA